MMTFVKIFIGHIEVKARLIQWADINRSKPVAFLVRCPYCQIERWGRMADLYVGFDHTSNNLKCKQCGACKVRYRDNQRRVVQIDNIFSPAPTGWRSIANNYVGSLELDTI